MTVKELKDVLDTMPNGYVMFSSKDAPTLYVMANNVIASSEPQFADKDGEAE